MTVYNCFAALRSISGPAFMCIVVSYLVMRWLFHPCYIMRTLGDPLKKGRKKVFKRPFLKFTAVPPGTAKAPRTKSTALLKSKFLQKLRDMMPKYKFESPG